MEIKLEYCPCCGGEAEMKHTSIYMSKARAVSEEALRVLL